MSEKQLMKAEELLGLITSPGSRSQEEAPLEDKKQRVSNDNSCVFVKETSSKDSASVFSHPGESEAVSCESDTISSHAFLEEPETSKSRLELDNHTIKAESDLKGNYNADICACSNEFGSESENNQRGQESNNKRDGHTETNLEFSKVDADVKTGGLETEFDNAKSKGSEFFGSVLKPATEESDVNLEMTVDLSELEGKNKALETESMDTSGGLSKEDKTEGEADLETYSQTGMEVEINVHELESNQGVIETMTEHFVDKSHTKLHLTEPEGRHSAAEIRVESKSYDPSQTSKLNQESVSYGYEDLKWELKSCKEELESTKKQLAKSERQLEKANGYNEDLRKQIEILSAEIHHYRHRTAVDIDIQVDKDELINYASGEMVLPDWGTTFQSSSNAAEAKTDETSAQAVSTEKMSIAESLKATAEAVVLEQSGFVYDQNSGLYYDYNSGYYYDHEKSLYYDPNSGTYFYYDHETNEYQFHSQVDVTCYQWQHQSGASNVQPGAAGATTQAVQNVTGPAVPSTSQQIVSKENLRKSEKRRKKEKKKEKEKDEKVYKNRKERRKALQERIEQKRQKKEKKDKKHHRHKKRKKKDDKKERKDREDKSEKYVEDKMRKRLKKKKKRHKREKEKNKVTGEVVEIKEENIQCELKKETAEVINMDEDETKDIKSKTETFDIEKTEHAVLDHSDVKPDIHVPISQSLENSILQVTQKENIENKSDREEPMECDNNADEIEVSHTDLCDASQQTERDNDAVVSRDSRLKTKETSETVEGIEYDLTVKRKEHKINEPFQQHNSGRADLIMVEDKNLDKLKPISENIVDLTNNTALKTEEKLDTSDKENDILDVELIVSEPDTRSYSDDKHTAVTDDSIVISSDSDSGSEMESGEISESEASQSESDSPSYDYTDSSPDSDSSCSEEEDLNPQNELAGGWPPCIRVMVTESCCLEVGTLFIVTCTGGTVGREKDMNHTIRIPDINVSKMHAEIKYDSRRGQYEIFDRGSQNGTYINDLRISEGKDSSTASPINHGDVLQLGDNKLLCHIHTGSDTCDKCEPGIVKANYFANQPKERITILSKEEIKQQQKQQLKEIKKKYGLKNAAYVDNTKAINNPQYTDKASERRKTVGSDGPEVKKQIPASVHRPISSENIGHKLLKKMGWSEGESLGKENTGIQEPVTVTLRANQTAGLGSSSSALFSPDDANSIDVKKAARRVQAQQRFSKLQSDPAGNQTDKPKTTRQWTKGETQYAEGGNS